MPKLYELGFTDYKDYLRTRHWRELTNTLITLNPTAECFICRKTNPKSHLLLHHIRYDNLNCEKIKRDLYVLCFSCHERVHFKQVSHKKIPLEEKVLLKRMRLLRYSFPVRNFRLGSSINTLFNYMLGL